MGERQASRQRQKLRLKERLKNCQIVIWERVLLGLLKGVTTHANQVLDQKPQDVEDLDKTQFLSVNLVMQQDLFVLKIADFYGSFHFPPYRIINGL